MRSLRPPKPGTSRFSKALPAPPVFETATDEGSKGSPGQEHPVPFSAPRSLRHPSSSSGSPSLSSTLSPFPPRTTSARPPPTPPPAFPPPPPKEREPPHPPARQPVTLDSPAPAPGPGCAPATGVAKLQHHAPATSSPGPGRAIETETGMETRPPLPAGVPIPIARRPIIALPSSPAPPRPNNNSSSATPAAPAAPTNTITSSTTSSTSSIPAPPVLPLPSPPSPVTSLSSILSAYTYSSSESTLYQSSQDANTGTPPSIKESPSQSSNMSHDERPPPPPAKDGVTAMSVARKPLPISKDVNVNHSATGTSGSQPQQQQPQSPPPAQSQSKTQQLTELWKRRSDKTDKPLGVSELKLTSSHGSTTAYQFPVPPASQQNSLLSQPANPSSSLLTSPAKSPQPPRSGGGLPGRNIRPTPTPTGTTSQTLTQTTASMGMGNVFSKVEAKFDSLVGRRRNDSAAGEDKPSLSTVSSKSDEQPQQQSRQQPQLHHPQPSPRPWNQQQQPQSPADALRRLPTPDYEQHDVKSPIVDHFRSPASPASSPELKPSQQPSTEKALPAVVQELPLPPPVVPSKDRDLQLQPPPAPGSNNSGSTLTTPVSAGPKMGGTFSSFPKSPRDRLMNNPREAAGSPARSPSPQQQQVMLPRPADQLQLQIPPQSKPPQSQQRSPTDGPSRTANPPSPAQQQQQFPTRTTSRGQGLPSSPQPRPVVGLPQPQQQPPSSPLTDTADDDRSTASTVRPPSSQQSFPQFAPGGARQPFRAYSPRPPPDNTVYKELVQRDDFDPVLARFPVAKLAATDINGVYAPRPLSAAHFACMHRHRSMSPTPNVNYPLACQTCARADAEERFRCRGCYLRICAPCRDVLGRHRGDLGALVEHVKNSAAAVVPPSPVGDAPGAVPGSPVVISPLSEHGDGGWRS